MAPESERFQQALAQRYRVALVRPVSLFEVPSLYDSPRRVQPKPESPDAEQAPQVEPRPVAQRLAG